MRIAFIRPNLGDFRARDAMEPVAFAILAARTPPGVALALHDERLAPVPLDLDVDLVALTVETYTARRAYQIAAHYRRRGIPVVMGGYHPTLVPEEVAGHCDAVAIGDAEGVWERIVEDARAGRLQAVYRHDASTPMAGVQPDRGIYAGKRYAPVSMVNFGRGCRLACDFCSIHAFYGKRVEQRPVPDLIRELESLPRRRPVFFVDDNLFSDRATLERMLDAIRPLGLRWVCQTTIDVTRDEPLLDKMAAAGCMLAVIGFESLSERNLARIGKKWNLARGDYAQGIARLHARGIMIYGSFVFGYDDDTEASFDRTVEFALAAGFCIANFNPLTPTPGTALMRRLREEGRLLHERWWLDPSFRYGDACFVPRAMTPEQLTEGCWRARRNFYSWSSIARRIASHPGLYANPMRLALLLASNAVSRREIRRKQGAQLGGEEPVAVNGASA